VYVPEQGIESQCCINPLKPKNREREDKRRWRGVAVDTTFNLGGGGVDLYFLFF
jgi:hypothetical protein